MLTRSRASVATIIRMPYIKFYFNPAEDYLCKPTLLPLAFWRN